MKIRKHRAPYVTQVLATQAAIDLEFAGRRTVNKKIKSRNSRPQLVYFFN